MPIDSSEAVLRAVYRAVLLGSAAALRDLFADDARVETSSFGGAVLHGREEIVDVLSRVHETGRVPVPDRFILLDPEWVLTIGQSRYELPKGDFGWGAVAWLNLVRGGQVVWGGVFKDAQQARAAYRAKKAQESRTQ